jgi:nitroreductase
LLIGFLRILPPPIGDEIALMRSEYDASAPSQNRNSARCGWSRQPATKDHGLAAAAKKRRACQLSFSEDELLLKKTGLLASMFPASWRVPNAKQKDVTDLQHSFLGSSLQDCPTLLIVIYDTQKRAPASAEDTLGIMSLGCVMENMWLAAEALGIGMQVLSVFSGREVEDQLHRVLGIPDYMKIAFACRLGYPAADGKYLRVRRHVREFTHHNRYGNYGLR